MSTYNGSHYIETQLDSIAAQDIENKFLLIRDDASNDDTVKIIQKYQKRYPWISYYEGQHAGVQKSFLELISKVDADTDYVAFADQDDEWLPEKLKRAICCLKKMDNANVEKQIPLLYCSDKQIVDDNLEPLQVTVSRPVRKISFGNALVQNICTGCTAVINRPLIDLLQKYPPTNPEYIIMHDWWLYLTASCFGKVYYDKKSYIKYRQHGKNTSGAMLNRRRLLKYRLEQLKAPRGEILLQINLFKSTFYSYMNKHNKMLIDELINNYTSFAKRIKIIFNHQYYRQKYSDNLVLKLLFIFKKL